MRAITLVGILYSFLIMGCSGEQGFPYVIGDSSVIKDISLLDKEKALPDSQHPDALVQVDLKKKLDKLVPDIKVPLPADLEICYNERQQGIPNKWKCWKHKQKIGPLLMCSQPGKCFTTRQVPSYSIFVHMTNTGDIPYKITNWKLHSPTYDTIFIISDLPKSLTIPPGKEKVFKVAISKKPKPKGYIEVGYIEIYGTKTKRIEFAG